MKKSTLVNHPLSSDLKGGELFMTVSLDRFSVKGPNEHNQFVSDYWREIEEVEELTCCGCGLPIDETEEYVESEFYGEEYIHRYKDCQEKYLMSIQKDLLGESKSLIKGNMA
jgi:hypothetical protein